MSNSQIEVVVIVPIYKNSLSPIEMTSLQFCKKNLKKFSIVVISPELLSKDELFIDFTNQETLHVKYFDNKFFSGIDGYNNLMLNVDFYKTFIEYKYMLICQLDTLVLSSDLSTWLKKDYDYTGAPWLSGEINPIFDSAGNGGLSLRKIKTFISIIEAKHFYYTDFKYNTTNFRAGIRNMIVIRILNKLQTYLPTLSYTKFFLFFYKGNEDYFWAFYAKFFIKEFKLSSIEDSLKFSFEVNPSFCFEQNKNELPFGTHAWERYDIEFWLKNIPGLKEVIDKND